MNQFPIGVMLNNLERNRLGAFAIAVRHGFRIVHTNALPEGMLLDLERGQYVAAARASGLTIASMFIGFDGQDFSDIATIARTVGLANSEQRADRCRIALAYSELAGEVGAPSLSLHLGFFPPEGTGDYRDLIASLHLILDRCYSKGQTLHLETGQEPASRLKRLLQDVAHPALGVNYDPGNFVIYGTDEPLAALETLGCWVRGVHCKDALPPTKPGLLGREVPLGTGQVRFDRMLTALQRIGYGGPLILEREQAPDPVSDILAARRYLHGLFAG